MFPEIMMEKRVRTNVKPNTAFSYLFYGKRTNVVWSKGLSVNYRGPRQQPEKKEEQKNPSVCVRVSDVYVSVASVPF